MATPEQALADFIAADASFVKAPPAPTMGLLKKVSYTHDAMIDLIIARHGDISQNELAQTFGYTAAWISNILASDSFQARLALRKNELVDPGIRLDVENGFKALVLRSIELLHEKLAQPNVGANTILRTLEISSRAAGYGARSPKDEELPGPDRLENLSERLVKLQRSVRTENGLPATVKITQTVEISEGLQGPRSEEREPIEGTVSTDGS